jgi:hypothetical protein
MRSSVGRAVSLYLIGRRFESCRVHFLFCVKKQIYNITMDLNEIVYSLPNLTQNDINIDFDFNSEIDVQTIYGNRVKKLTVPVAEYLLANKVGNYVSIYCLIGQGYWYPSTENRHKHIYQIRIIRMDNNQLVIAEPNNNEYLIYNLSLYNGVFCTRSVDPVYVFV